MSVLEERTKFTYHDYLQLPDDRKRYQVIEGELHMVPAPSPHHQDILGKLFIFLRTFVKGEGLGKVYQAPCDVVLSNEDIVQPDIFFISKEREHIITERNIQGAPELIVEILSSSTAKLDKSLKTRLYEEFGVKEYWLVDPEKEEIEVLSLEERGYESLGVFGKEGFLKSSLFTQLGLNLAEIFSP